MQLSARAGRVMAALAVGVLVTLPGCGEASSVPAPTASSTSAQVSQQARKSVDRHKDDGSQTAAKAQTRTESTEAGTYPEKYGEAYLAGCEHRGGTSGLCVCILRNSEAKIPFTKFQREGIAAARSKGNPSQAPALAAVVRRCVEVQAAQTEQENYNPTKEKEKAEAFAASMFGSR